jgi:hypothetical protein
VLRRGFHPPSGIEPRQDKPKRCRGEYATTTPCATALVDAECVQIDRNDFLLILVSNRDILFDVAAAAAMKNEATNRVTSAFLKSTATMPEAISGGSPREIRDILVDVASRTSEAVGQQNQTFPLYLNEWNVVG